MALQVTETLAGGVVATYLKATVLHSDTLQGVINVDTRSYLNKTERDAGVDNNLRGGTFALTGPMVLDQSGDWRPWAYDQLVAQVPEFSGATNV